MNELKAKKRSLLCLTLVWCFAACGELPTPIRDGGPGQSDDATTRSLLGKQISLSELDSMNFKPSGARVGLQSYFSYSSPIVGFSIPKQSNYVEILRCADTLKVVGTVDEIEVRTLDLGFGFEQQHEILKRNDFWTLAKTAGCQQITSGLADENYFDIASPDGSSFYVIRACVLPERVSDLTAPANEQAAASAACSRMITTTGVLRYANDRASAQKQKLAEAQQLADKAFGLTRLAISVAVKLNNELTACQTEQAAQAQKKSIFDWLQQGLGFAKTLFPIFNIGFDVDKINSGIDMIKNIFGQGQPNLPASCKFAIELQTQGKGLATEIEALQKKYMTLFGEADSGNPTLYLKDAYENEHQ